MWNFQRSTPKCAIRNIRYITYLFIMTKRDRRDNIIQFSSRYLLMFLDNPIFFFCSVVYIFRLFSRTITLVLCYVSFFLFYLLFLLMLLLFCCSVSLCVLCGMYMWWYNGTRKTQWRSCLPVSRTGRFYSIVGSILLFYFSVDSQPTHDDSGWHKCNAILKFWTWNIKFCQMSLIYMSLAIVQIGWRGYMCGIVTLFFIITA